MKKALLLVIMILALISNLYSETFYIYVEETYNGEEPSICSPAKESLLDGLFELGHIAFDDIEGEGDINWNNEAFDSIINKGLYGGARILFLVNISSHSEINDDDMLSIVSTAEYYCIDLRIAKIIDFGSINMDNFYKEEQINQEELGFLLGSELSYIVDTVYKEYIVQL